MLLSCQCTGAIPEAVILLHCRNVDGPYHILQAVRVLWELCPPDPPSNEDLNMDAKVRESCALKEQEKKVYHQQPDTDAGFCRTWPLYSMV